MEPWHTLRELARQVRGGTLELLAAAPRGALTWAPPGTSNHILWHAGHALWLQDVLGVRLLSGTSELPPGWANRFGMDCAPLESQTAWPERGQIADHLHRQFHRVMELLDQEHPRGPGCEDRLHRMVHGWHDEARHQGEMYLLLKQYRAGVAL